MKKLVLVLCSVMLLCVASDGMAQKGQNPNPKQRRVEVVKPPKSKVVNNLPRKALPVNHRTGGYYFKGNRYYKQNGSRYAVVHPPFGLRVPALPKHFRQFIFNTVSYYIASGVIYAKTGNEYVVVEPVVGMVVPELPELNVSTLRIDGTIYYEFEGVLYKEIPTPQGTQYRVEGRLD